MEDCVGFYGSKWDEQLEGALLVEGAGVAQLNGYYSQCHCQEAVGGWNSHENQKIYKQVGGAHGVIVRRSGDITTILPNFSIHLKKMGPIYASPAGTESPFVMVYPHRITDSDMLPTVKDVPTDEVKKLEMMLMSKPIVEVSGAGMNSINGVYAFAGFSDGRAMYKLGKKCRLAFDEGTSTGESAVWCLYRAGSGDVPYTNPQQSMLPPDAGWVASKGKHGTAPTIMEIKDEPEAKPTKLDAPTSRGDELVSGQRVCISGLQGRPELNGQTVVVMGFDQGKGRWLVQLNSTSQMSIKPGNLQSIGAAALPVPAPAPPRDGASAPSVTDGGSSGDKALPGMVSTAEAAAEVTAAPAAPALPAAAPVPADEAGVVESKVESKKRPAAPEPVANKKQELFAAAEGKIVRSKFRACFLGVPSSKRPGAKARADVDLLGVAGDLMKTQEHWTKKTGAGVSSKSSYGEMSLGEVTKKITGFLNENSPKFDHRDTEADTYILQFSGHGYDVTGNWSTDDNKEVTLDDVLTIWDASYAKEDGGLLVIVLDSCHSGAWVNDARRRLLKDVAIQAACDADEVSFDGTFTRLIVRYQSELVKKEVALEALQNCEEPMNPVCYVPWADADLILTSNRSKKPFRFLTAEVKQGSSSGS